MGKLSPQNTNGAHMVGNDDEDDELTAASALAASANPKQQKMLLAESQYLWLVLNTESI